jgi:hypothetical protein
VNYWSDHEQKKTINSVSVIFNYSNNEFFKTESAEVEAAFQKEGEELGIQFEFVGPFPGSAEAGLANLNRRKTVDPLGGNASSIIGSLFLLFFSLIILL